VSLKVSEMSPNGVIFGRKGIILPSQKLLYNEGMDKKIFCMERRPYICSKTIIIIHSKSLTSKSANSNHSTKFQVIYDRRRRK
jgi:hypothetical protein